jgi:hypothetical protein
VLYDPAVYGCLFNLGNITINGSTDATGCDRILTGETGWFAAPAIKTARVDKPAARGVFRGNEFRGGRVITLQYTLSAPTVAALRAAQRNDLGLCPDPHSQYPLTVTEESGYASYANVVLDGEILMTPIAWNSCAVSLQLVAPDPRKISTASRVVPVLLASAGSGGVAYPVTYPVSYGTPGRAGSVTLANGGTAEADPSFSFAGPLTNPAVIRADTGDTVAYNGTLTATDVLTIDFGTGNVLLDQVNRRALVSANNWFAVPANGSITVLFQTTNLADTGIVTATVADAGY